MFAAIFAAISPLLGPLLKLGISYFTKMNTKEMVQRAEAKEIVLDDDEIETLVHTYHFGSTPQRKADALAALRAKGAMI